ncbi:unnamed protein product [Closterium sp. Naga37s-1]|nr:unnamed protein product [Closterium sp. Naga37s-1]
MAYRFDGLGSFERLDWDRLKEFEKGRLLQHTPSQLQQATTIQLQQQLHPYPHHQQQHQVQFQISPRESDAARSPPPAENPHHPISNQTDSGGSLDAAGFFLPYPALAVSGAVADPAAGVASAAVAPVATAAAGGLLTQPGGEFSWFHVEIPRSCPSLSAAARQLITHLHPPLQLQEITTLLSNGPYCGTLGGALFVRINSPGPMESPYTFKIAARITPFGIGTSATVTPHTSVPGSPSDTPRPLKNSVGAGSSSLEASAIAAAVADGVGTTGTSGAGGATVRIETAAVSLRQSHSEIEECVTIEGGSLSSGTIEGGLPACGSGVSQVKSEGNLDRRGLLQGLGSRSFGMGSRGYASDAGGGGVRWGAGAGFSGAGASGAGSAGGGASGDAGGVGGKRSGGVLARVGKVLEAMTPRRREVREEQVEAHTTIDVDDAVSACPLLCVWLGCVWLCVWRRVVPYRVGKVLEAMTPMRREVREEQAEAHTTIDVDDAELEELLRKSHPENAECLIPVTVFGLLQHIVETHMEHLEDVVELEELLQEIHPENAECHCDICPTSYPLPFPSVSPTYRQELEELLRKSHPENAECLIPELEELLRKSHPENAECLIPVTVFGLLQHIVETHMEHLEDVVVEVECMLDQHERDLDEGSDHRLRLLKDRTFPKLHLDLQRVLQSLAHGEVVLPKLKDRLVARSWCAGPVASAVLDGAMARLRRGKENVGFLTARITALQTGLDQWQSEQINKKLYYISFLSIVFLPLSIITGAFGMNVGGVPWVQQTTNDPNVTKGFISVMWICFYVVIALGAAFAAPSVYAYVKERLEERKRIGKELWERARKVMNVLKLRPRGVGRLGEGYRWHESDE